MSRPPVFGWKAHKLADLSFDELNGLREMIISDPKNHNPAHKTGRSIFLYTKAAQRKIDAVAWAVTYKLQENKRRQLAESADT